MENERIESDLCVGDRELAVCDREDLVIVGDVESWWGSAVGVGSIVREYVRVAGSNEDIGGAAVGGEGDLGRVDGEDAMYGTVCGKLDKWHPRRWCWGLVGRALRCIDVGRLVGLAGHPRRWSRKSIGVPPPRF